MRFLKLVLCIMSVSYASAGVTVEVNSLEQYNEELETSGQILVVVEFCAQWAGPCRVLATQLKALAMNHDLILLKVDVDHANDVAADEEISAVPTLKFYKEGAKLSEFQGADESRVEAEVYKYLN